MQKNSSTGQSEKKQITLSDVIAEKKLSKKIPVCIGDTNNTIIFIREDQDPEVVKAYFLSKLDPYNPARSEVKIKDESDTKDIEGIIEKRNDSYLRQKEENQRKQIFSPFKF